MRREQPGRNVPNLNSVTVTVEDPENNEQTSEPLKTIDTAEPPPPYDAVGSFSEVELKPKESRAVPQSTFKIHVV